MTQEECIKAIGKRFIPTSYVAITRALSREPLTAKQLSSRLGFDYTVIWDALVRMREWGLVHVCGVSENGKGRPNHIYKMGKPCL